jgi:3-polyprenyl-4-hydroxybenzoate decarboxylase
MPDYIERSVPAHTLSRGDILGTFNGRRTSTVFRKVERVSERDGYVYVTIAGSVLPESIPRATPVVVRVRRTR